MPCEWFLAHWPSVSDRWSVEFYAASQDELAARMESWLAARPAGAAGSYFFGSFDVARAKLLKELRRVAHNRDVAFAATWERFGRRVMRLEGLSMSAPSGAVARRPAFEARARWRGPRRRLFH